MHTTLEDEPVLLDTRRAQTRADDVIVGRLVVSGGYACDVVQEANSIKVNFQRQRESFWRDLQSRAFFRP